MIYTLPFLSAGISPLSRRRGTVSALFALLTALASPFFGFLPFVVSAVAFAVFLFASRRENGGKFWFLMNTFLGFMLLLTTTQSKILFFLAWEGMGICSFFLIGLEKENYRQAVRALLTNIFGDAFLLYGLLSIPSRTLNFASAPETALAAMSIAVLTKSAQFPFHYWLADAMVAPSTVSALLHSSTMVASGVYLAYLVSQSATGTLFFKLIAVFAAASHLLGELKAVTEKHAKLILAYSTVSHLGLMLLSISLFALNSKGTQPVMVYLAVHAFYKAALFLFADAAHRETGSYDVRMWSFAPGIYILPALSLAGLYPFDPVRHQITPGIAVYLLLLSGIYAGRFLKAMRGKVKLKMSARERTALILLSLGVFGFRSAPSASSIVLPILGLIVGYGTEIISARDPFRQEFAGWLESASRILHKGEIRKLGDAVIMILVLLGVMACYLKLV